MYLCFLESIVVGMSNKSLYLEHLLLERTKWEEEIRANLRGGLGFIEDTKHIREGYLEHINRIDSIIKEIND